MVGLWVPCHKQQAGDQVELFVLTECGNKGDWEWAGCWLRWRMKAGVVWVRSVVWYWRGS